MLSTGFFLSLAVLATQASAHMVLKEPKPFPTNNSPLEENGSNYPCKVTSYAADSRTEYPVGSTQTLRFTGSAVHGGGSCQVAITYDKNPTKNSEFKVIHSIEGGCPAKNLAGNLPSNPSGDAPDGYDFKIPADLPTGDAILAWTWFNRIGNREMYMNCAPIKITGSGDGNKAAFSSLPDIMIANIGEKMCKVAEGSDAKFPNPGKSVSSNPFGGTLQDLSSQPACYYNWMAGGPKPAAASPVDLPASAYAASVAAAAAAAGDPSTVGSTTSAFESAASSLTSDTPAKSGVATTVTNGVTSTVVSASTAKGASSIASVPAPSGVSPSAPAKPIASAASSFTTSASTPTAATFVAPGAGGNGCAENAFMCLGAGFKQCVNGVWSMERPLAAGTKCTPGVSTKLDVLAVRNYRA